MAADSENGPDRDAWRASVPESVVDRYTCHKIVQVASDKGGVIRNRVFAKKLALAGVSAALVAAKGGLRLRSAPSG